METVISDPSQRRRRFDPSMSRRTRKPAIKSGSPEDEAAEESPETDRALPRVSLQELITADGGGCDAWGREDGEGNGTNGTVLRNLVDILQEDEKKMVHVEIIVERDHEDLERNKLAIVAKQPGGEPGMVTRYVRLLTDLMKARRRSSKKKKNELMISGLPSSKIQ